jgi:hypothetical protein
MPLDTNALSAGEKCMLCTRSHSGPEQRFGLESNVESPTDSISNE